MNNDKINILRCDDVNQILENKEKEIIDIVKDAYVAHQCGKSSLPHSIFLRFPDNQSDRIIGLPAYIEMERKMAGMKWIASFPKNTVNGMERASAVLILNNMDNGRPEAILESSIISAKRTAASAALGAIYLHQNMDETKIGLIGCGRINKEILHFILFAFKKIDTIYLFDQFEENAETFAKKNPYEGIQYVVVKSADEIFSQTKLISCATTAGTPYIDQIHDCDEKTTILGISLRDFAPSVMEKVHNIVDDVDHVCREKTSIHLTQQKLNNLDFVTGSIAQVVMGEVPARAAGKPVIYSPFGLGILDLAVGYYVKDEAEKMGLGIEVDHFLP